jgi:serine/threonine protein kinase
MAMQVGRYKLIAPLGVGGMAEVFKAESSGPGGFARTVVIKRILPAHCEDPEFVRMFVAEAKILGMLHHQNVVQAYDFGETDGSLFLVLEYIDGPSILRVMQTLRAMGRLMPTVIAAYFAFEVCRALDYVHNLNGSDGEPLNVIHRDVTPSNILLTSSGGLKLLDFGVARYSASGARSEHGTIKGKASYLAPEALIGNGIDARVDIFSLGVVLHEMLTLTTLFSSDHHLGTLKKVMEMPIPPPSAARPEVSSDLDAIVMKALQRKPALRYASAGEMARDLDQFVSRARLQTDQVVQFVRDVQAEISRNSLQARTPSAPSLFEDANMTPTTHIEGGLTERDLYLRFRMSFLGRLIFGPRRDDPR